MSSKTSKSTKLERHLNKTSAPDSPIYCSCDPASTKLYIRHTVYLGCTKCGKTFSRQLGNEQAQKIQRGKS